MLLSGRAAKPASSSRCRLVSGSGLPFFINPPLSRRRPTRADDASFALPILGLGPGVNNQQDKHGFGARHADCLPSLFALVRIWHRDGEGVTKNTGSQVEAHAVLFQIPRFFFRIPGPAHALVLVDTNM